MKSNLHKGKMVNSNLPEVYDALMTDKDLELMFLMKMGWSARGMEINEPLWIPTN